MRKSYLVVSVITILISVSAFTKLEEPRYKNLKILPKDITKPVLDSIMKSYARALGVKCDFCHAKNVGKPGLDFASDKEEAKEEARGMMRMQAKINKKFFSVKNAGRPGTKLEVTCFTCHHGQGHPETKAPALPEGQGRPGAPGAPKTPGASPSTPPSPVNPPAKSS